MADRDTQKDENVDDRNIRECNTTSVLDERDLSNNHRDKIIKESVSEEKRQSASSSEKSSEKLHDAKGSGHQITSEKVKPGDLNELSNAESPKDNQPSIVEESNDLPSKVPPSSLKETGEGNSGEPSPPANVAKDTDLSDSLPLQKNDPGQPVTSNSVAEPSQPSNAMDTDIASESLLSENAEPEKQITSNSKGEPSQSAETPKDVDMVSDSLPTEINEPQHTDSIINETATGISLSLFLSPNLFY